MSKLPASPVPQIPIALKVLWPAPAVGIWLWTAWRAAALPVAHDEACTYLWFLASPGSLFNPDANNHLLYTLSARAATTLLGPSELVLRLPALLGAALYLAAGSAICNRIWSAPGARTLTLALLSAAPLTVELMPAARGYGLGLGFFAAALWLFISSLDRDDGGIRLSLGGLAFGSACLGLASAANFAFLPPAAGLTGAAIVLSGGRPRPFRRLVPLLCAILLPLIVVFLGITAPLVTHLQKEQFYAGHPSLALAVSDGIQAHLFPREFPLEPGATAAAPLPRQWSGLLTAVLAAWLAASVWRTRRDPIGLPLSAPLAAALLAHFAAESLLGLPYPPARSTLYWAPLLILGGAVMVRGLPSRARLTATVAALAALGWFVHEWSPHAFRLWPYDADSRGVFRAVEGSVARVPTPVVRIGGNWLLEPSMNYYRLARQVKRLAPYERQASPAPRDYDYFLTLHGGEAAPERQDFAPLYRSARSGVTVWARPKEAKEGL